MAGCAMIPPTAGSAAKQTPLPADHIESRPIAAVKEVISMMNSQMNMRNSASHAHCVPTTDHSGALLLSVMVMIAPLALIAVSILGNLH